MKISKDLSSDDYSLSILVPTQFVGLLIGKNGSCFRELAKSSKCRLFLQSYEDIPELSRERVLTMIGSKASVLLALRKVIEIIQPCTKSMGSQVGTWESQADGNQIIKWVILQSDCGTLIGRGGEGIKRINELSGSWVKVAHLEDSVRGAKERLVYIRGRPEQNIHALQIIIDKVGGWPYTTPISDSDIARIDEKTSMFIPFLAIPYVFFDYREEFHGCLFPPEDISSLPQIAGAVINIDSGFFTSSAEAQIHIIGPKDNREQAKSIIMSKLSEWLKLQQSSNPSLPMNSLDKRIPKQFSAQFADQFAEPLPAHLGGNSSTLSVTEYMARLRHNLDTLSALDQTDMENYDGNDTCVEGYRLSDTPEILDVGIKMLLSMDSKSWFEGPYNRFSDDSVAECVHKLTGCYIQVLPNNSIVSKSIGVVKVCVIGPSLTLVIRAQELLLEFIHAYKPDAHPTIPIQVDKKKSPQGQQQQALALQQLRDLTPRQQQALLADQLSQLSLRQMQKREQSLGQYPSNNQNQQSNNSPSFRQHNANNSFTNPTENGNRSSNVYHPQQGTGFGNARGVHHMRLQTHEEQQQQQQQQDYDSYSSQVTSQQISPTSVDSRYDGKYTFAVPSYHNGPIPIVQPSPRNVNAVGTPNSGGSSPFFGQRPGQTDVAYINSRGSRPMAAHQQIPYQPNHPQGWSNKSQSLDDSLLRGSPFNQNGSKSMYGSGQQIPSQPFKSMSYDEQHRLPYPMFTSITNSDSPVVGSPVIAPISSHSGGDPRVRTNPSIAAPNQYGVLFNQDLVNRLSSRSISPENISKSVQLPNVPLPTVQNIQGTELSAKSQPFNYRSNLAPTFMSSIGSLEATVITQLPLESVSDRSSNTTRSAVSATSSLDTLLDSGGDSFYTQYLQQQKLQLNNSTQVFSGSPYGHDDLSSLTESLRF